MSAQQYEHGIDKTSEALTSMSPKEPMANLQKPFSVAVIGGGVAGSTIALRLSELGIETHLLEKGPSLVNGPPICHLHAGGNLYREISEEQCIKLLKQSIDTVKIYPHCLNLRPTVVAVPTIDPGTPEQLIPRLETLKSEYKKLVETDPSNQVLGNPEDYFKLFDKATLQALADKPLPETPTSYEDWLIPVAKQTNLDQLKFPVILVQEYGLSAFRFAAMVTLAGERLDDCHVHTETKVISIERSQQSNFNQDGLTNQWTLETRAHGQTSTLNVDYIVNACGFRSGEIDDMLNAKRDRMVEFKAAYVTHWPDCKGHWPEVIFYGERGTPQGMAQLTPYHGGYFQLHGMTEDITLFKDGLVASNKDTAQPKLPPYLLQKIEQQWPDKTAQERTQASIDHMAQFIPDFAHAKTAGKPLYGAQQIPGDDPSLRAADVSFDHKNYARTEIVKASSALTAADAVLNDILNKGLVELDDNALSVHKFDATQSLNADEVDAKAMQIAKDRAYPEALAKQLK